MGIAETENTVNVPLLRKAVEWVEGQAALPEIDREWEQAGYQIRAADRAWLWLLEEVGGGRIRNRQEIDQIVEHCGTAYCVAGYIGMTEDSRYAERTVVDGVHVGEFARKRLGLTQEQACMLFNGQNDAADVRRIAEHFAGERL